MSLQIKNFSVNLGKLAILRDINLSIESGKVHVLMGPNGSGKSTLAWSLLGNKNYRVKNADYELVLDGKNIKNLRPDERAKEGLFLTFQNPVGISGVNVQNLLQLACQNRKAKAPLLSVWDINERILKTAGKLGIPPTLLKRSLSDALSGGEKKKLEMLQALILRPKYVIFDEIDTGLDVDALKIIARGINELKKKGRGILLITHYQRILRFIKPDFVHILVKGQIVESGDYKLAEKVEKSGYKRWTNH